MINSFIIIWHLFTSFILNIGGSHCSAEDLNALGYNTVCISGVPRNFFGGEGFNKFSWG